MFPKKPMVKVARSNFLESRYNGNAITLYPILHEAEKLNIKGYFSIYDDEIYGLA